MITFLTDKISRLSRGVQLPQVELCKPGGIWVCSYKEQQIQVLLQANGKWHQPLQVSNMGKEGLRSGYKNG